MYSTIIQRTSLKETLNLPSVQAPWLLRLRPWRVVHWVLLRGLKALWTIKPYLMRLYWGSVEYGPISSLDLDLDSGWGPKPTFFLSTG